MQSTGRAVDAAHADALGLRNKQYQKLLEDHQKLNVAHAKQRELGRHQAGQLHDQQVCMALSPKLLRACRVPPKTIPLTAVPMKLILGLVP